MPTGWVDAHGKDCVAAWGFVHASGAGGPANATSKDCNFMPPGRPWIRMWPFRLAFRHVSTFVRLVSKASGIRTASDGARVADKTTPCKTNGARARNAAFNPRATCLHRAGTGIVAYGASTKMRAMHVLVLGCATTCNIIQCFRSGCGRIVWAQGPAE